MIGFEPSGDDIFGILPEEVRETTVTEINGPLTISRVDPEKVERLIRTLLLNGVKQISWG